MSLADWALVSLSDEQMMIQAEKARCAERLHWRRSASHDESRENHREIAGARTIAVEAAAVAIAGAAPVAACAAVDACPSSPGDADAAVAVDPGSHPRRTVDR